MFGSKQKDGLAIIENAVSVFENVKQELNSGIELCDTEECDLDEQIEELKKRKYLVQSSRAKAVKVRHNIEQMLK